ncbi:MAG: MBL fold metallo-hydrolase [Lachnospiraceae bacterium]|nr:MBL fold metallo-hydrolase [Lachnospiraceae bacterium]
MLRFFGRGSAFCKDNNSAFFIQDGALILLDLPMSSFHRLIGIGIDKLAKEAGLDRFSAIQVLVTHTHSDHIGGIPMLIHYAYYVLDKLPVTVIAPTREVADDLRFLLQRLEGCEDTAYTVTCADALAEGSCSWLCDVIPTVHTPQLSGRCFGYRLLIGSRYVLYTGDTNTLSPFASFLTEGTILYTEISAIDTPVHLCLAKEMGNLESLLSRGISVYLMHLDNEEAVKEMIAGTGLQLAPLI